MRTFKLLGAVVFAICITAHAFADDTKDNGDLTIPGVVTVPAPADGFGWKKISSSDDTATPKVEIFTASKDGSTSKLVFIVERSVVKSNDDRVGRIKGEYEEMIDSLQKQGCTDVKGSNPPLDQPIGERVSFTVTATNKTGKPLVYQTTVLFEKNVYHFTAFAETQDEAKALAKVIDLMKENAVAPTTEKATP
jgi:hypothetical protein